MTFILRQSTSASFYMGPFIDLTAGTAETGLTIDATEVWLSKNGGAYANKNEATAMVHAASGGSGMYLLVLDATDTNTVGTLSVLVNDTAAAAIPMAAEYQVVETAVYDALYANAATAFNSTGQVSLLTATQASIDAIETDTGTTIPATITTIDALIDSIAAEVVTAATEPALGAPPVSATRGTKLDWLYKAWRNKSTQTATLYSLRDDGDTQTDTKATISDDGTTLTYGEKVTGP
jgi:hypothetical protein